MSNQATYTLVAAIETSVITVSHINQELVIYSFEWCNSYFMSSSSLESTSNNDAQTQYLALEPFDHRINLGTTHSGNSSGQKFSFSIVSARIWTGHRDLVLTVLTP